MNLLAWVSLIGASLFFAGMLYVNYPEPHRTGEKAMLSAMGMVFHSLGFFGCLTALAVALHALGRLDWIAKSGQVRIMILIAGVIALALTFFFSAVLRNENWDKVPAWGIQIARLHGMIWIPLLALLAAFLLLVSTEKSTVPLSLAKISATISVGVSLLFCSSLLMAWMRQSAEKQARIIEAHQRSHDEYHQRSMETINAFDESQGLSEILPLAGRYQDEDIREQALKKIKARENWEEELFELLESKGGYRDVFTFLECNRVTNRKRFADSLERTLNQVANEIQREVKDTNNLQDWSFEWYRVESALAAIDFQFSDVGVNFVPAVEKIRSALDDHRPERFEKVQVKVSTAVKNWLKKKGSR
jgi:hypothetical protein